VDIADNYEHKHQDLSSDDPTKGLMKMSGEIAKALFRILSAEGVRFDRGTMLSLLARYGRIAEDTVTRYHADSMINGLFFDRHLEETAAETFAHALKLSSEEFFADPLGAPLIPNWNRVSSALPGFLGALSEAVDADNAESAAHSRPVLAWSRHETEG
jgi:glucosyl-3-phosphoglycerate synthase